MWSTLGMHRLMRLLVLVAVTSATMYMASTAGAADPYPPLWRGTTGSTFQEWRFSTNSYPEATPESVDNAFGVPSATIDYLWPWGSGWYDTLPVPYGQNAQGWWDISAGSIVLNIINHPNIGVNVSKDIKVQVTYWNDMSKPPSVLVTPPAPTPSVPQPWFVSKTTSLGSVEWRIDLWTFHVDPNLNSETITVKGDPIMGSQIDKIVVDTRYVAAIGSASQARTLPEGTVVELTGPVVTRSFGSFFYMEDISRATGIRVNYASGSFPAQGSVPRVSGVLRTTVEGERVIDQAVVTNGAGSTIPRPLVMNCRSASEGLSPQGLLVWMSGLATVPTGQSWFMMNDGSPQAVKVQLYGISAPPDGRYVTVTGVLGADAGGPVLRMNATDVITVLP